MGQKIYLIKLKLKKIVEEIKSFEGFKSKKLIIKKKFLDWLNLLLTE